MSENWIEIPFKDVVKYQKGKKPKRLENEEFEGSIPYLDIKAFEKGEVRRYADVESSNIIDSSSVGVVWDGARSGWVTKGQSGAIGSTIAKLTPVEVDVDYLFWFLESNFHELNSNTKGTGIPHVNPEVIWNLKFPLAPLNEQKRIAHQLDTIFEKLNKNKTRLERIPQLLKDFRQTVLQAAVTGELTKEWREENDTEKIDLKKIEKERERLKRLFAIERGKNSFNYKPSVNISLGDKTKGINRLLELPKNWVWSSLDNITWNISDGPHFSPKYVEPENGKRFISARNINYRGINFEDSKYVSFEDHNKFLERGKPEKGDVILTKGGSTGIACLIDDDDDFSYWVHLALLKPINKFVIPNYLTDALTSELLYNQSQALTHGTGNRDLGLTRMTYIALPLPPMSEQQEIVARVEELFLLADAIEQKYEQVKIKIEQLPQAILDKAFKGELVEQDPNDEPASELLKKIKEAKKARKKSKK